jgi:hypothetical protein
VCSGFSLYVSVSVLRVFPRAVWVPTSVSIYVEGLQFKEPGHYNLDPSCIQTISRQVSKINSCVCSAPGQSVHRNLLVCVIYVSCHCSRYMCSIEYSLVHVGC